MPPPRESTAPPPKFGPHPDDTAEVCAAFAEAESDPGVALTPEELRRLAEDGEMPASLG
jgi:hypothetical protein